MSLIDVSGAVAFRVFQHAVYLSRVSLYHVLYDDVVAREMWRAACAPLRILAVGF